MTKHLIKYRSLVAAIFVLMPFLFWFSYSELGQFTFEKEHPATQDYCEIVKVTKAETGKTSVSDLFKLKVVQRTPFGEKSFSLHCIYEASKHCTLYYQLDIEHFHSPQKTTEIYLFNRAFLI